MYVIHIFTMDALLLHVYTVIIHRFVFSVFFYFFGFIFFHIKFKICYIDFEVLKNVRSIFVTYSYTFKTLALC